MRPVTSRRLPLIQPIQAEAKLLKIIDLRNDDAGWNVVRGPVATGGRPQRASLTLPTARR